MGMERCRKEARDERSPREGEIIVRREVTKFPNFHKCVRNAR